MHAADSTRIYRLRENEAAVRLHQQEQAAACR
jgi:hypothetical protein